MMQDLILRTYLTPLVGATPKVQVYTGRAYHSVPVLIFAATMPTSFPLKNLPAFGSRCTPKLAARRISSEMFDKNHLPEIRSYNYIPDENLRPKSNSF